MNRFFAIYHGLTPGAPWGVACERVTGAPKVELLMLCRTEKEAAQCATLTSLGQELKLFRDRKVGQRAEQAAGAK